MSYQGRPCPCFFHWWWKWGGPGDRVKPYVTGVTVLGFSWSWSRRSVK